MQEQVQGGEGDLDRECERETETNICIFHLCLYFTCVYISLFFFCVSSDCHDHCLSRPWLTIICHYKVIEDASLTFNVDFVLLVAKLKSNANTLYKANFHPQNGCANQWVTLV